MSARVIHQVVAGVLVDEVGRVLINQRRPGTHMAGRWEFPGGKLKPGEAVRAGLARELREELGIRVEAARPLIRVSHRYPDRVVMLAVWRVDRYAGEPSARDGQTLRWALPADLPRYDLLEADRPIVTALQMPSHYLITGQPRRDPGRFLELLERALERGVRLVQLRIGRGTDKALQELAQRALDCCVSFGARMLIYGEPDTTAALVGKLGAAGIHLPAKYLHRFASRPVPAPLLLAASCRSAEELARAEQIGANFAVLGPVRARAPDPDAQRLGWEDFHRLVNGVNMPVYAAGGMELGDLGKAWQAGAQGIAAIRSLWDPDEELRVKS